MACAILERTSGLEPSSEATAPRYLKLVTMPNFCPFTCISLWVPYLRPSASQDQTLVLAGLAFSPSPDELERHCLALFVISLVFSALISVLYLVQVL